MNGTPRTSGRSERAIATAWATLLIALCGPAWSATIPADPAAAEGLVDDDRCSLHEAIHEANSPGTHSGGTGLQDECSPGSSGEDTIELGLAATYTLTVEDHIDTYGPTGLPDVLSPIVIEGNDSTIQRDPSYDTCDEQSVNFRFFQIRASAAEGALTLNRVTLSNGCIVGLSGGAIYGFGGPEIVLNDCLIIGNTAEQGGAMYLRSGHLTLNRTTVSGNTASVAGALYMFGEDYLPINRITLNNSTVSDNTADFSVGAIYNWAVDTFSVLTLNSSTLTGNSAPGVGGIFNRDWGSDWAWVISRNSIVAAQADGADCANDGGTFESAGYNIESGASCGFTFTGDQQNVIAPLLLPADDNGGPTPTHLPLPGCSAIDAGNPGGCYGDSNGDGTLDTLPLATDQRGLGYRREVDGDGDGSPRCDVGAVELHLIFADGFESGGASAWSAVVGG